LGQHHQLRPLLHTGQHIDPQALGKRLQQRPRGFHQHRAAQHRLAHNQAGDMQAEFVSARHAQQEAMVLQRVQQSAGSWPGKRQALRQLAGIQRVIARVEAAQDFKPALKRINGVRWRAGSRRVVRVDQWPAHVSAPPQA
jgi:hypothetical protein